MGGSIFATYNVKYVNHITLNVHVSAVDMTRHELVLLGDHLGATFSFIPFQMTPKQYIAHGSLCNQIPTSIKGESLNFTTRVLFL